MTNVYTEKYHQFLDMRCWITLLYAYKDMIFKVFQSALHNTRRWEDEIIDKRSRKSQIYTKKMCIKLYFFKEIWSSSCIDGHDLYIISNMCLHRNCQVVSLQTFKTHFTLLISLEFLVVLSYHLVTQIMYNTLCFINGTLDPFKGDVMNVMTQLFWPQAPQKCWRGCHINTHR
jgi:hypothetical protein